MSTKATQADYARTALRLPRDLHRAVHEAAKAGDRTFNGQIVAMLRKVLFPTVGGSDAQDQRGG